jgi:hypothetical protein
MSAREGLNSMFNPIDTNVTKSMIEYRREQLQADACRSREDVELERTSISFKRLHPVRWAVGIRLIRLGARLAGMSLQGRMSAQP